MSTISRIANAKKYYDGVMLLERMAELHTPAVSIAVIENYEISETCVYGVKKKTSKEAITPMAELHTPAVSIAVIENYEQSCICSGSYPFDRTGYIGY